MNVTNVSTPYSKCGSGAHTVNGDVIFMNLIVDSGWQPEVAFTFVNSAYLW